MRSLQQEIIAELGVKPSINPEEEFLHRSQFLASELGRTGKNGFVLGVSGGQDSLLAGMIAKQATEIASDHGHHAELYTVLLPYNTQVDLKDAQTAIKIIKPHSNDELNIGPTTDSFVRSFESLGMLLTDFNKGNVKARMRMVAQYAISGAFSNLLVVGTDHAAEAITGFYTKYGDGAADVLPLAGLNKRQGSALLTYLGVPSIFTSKAPTADLLDNAPSQPDETELGIPYDVVDDYLEGKTIDPQQAEELERRFIMTAHKRAMPTSYTDYNG